MKDETLGWLDLASHLSMSLQRVKRETTSSEFVLWMVYLRELPNRFNALYHYLAQIAFEIRQSAFFAKRKRWRLTDFLLKFVWGESEKRPETQTEFEAREAQVARSKSFWLGFVGMGEEKK